MHATAREANIVRRLNAHVAGLTLPGAPVLIAVGDDVTPVPVDRPSVRLSMVQLAARYVGRYDASSAGYIEHVLLTADVFYPTQDGSGVPTSGYLATECGDALRDGLTRLALPVLDYSTDPANPTTVDGAHLLTVDLPQITRLPASDGLSRVQVTVPVQWTQAHADAA